MSGAREPLIEIAIEPRNRDDQEKLEAALKQVAREDTAFHVSIDAESGQIIIKGMSEQHIEAMVARLTRGFGIDAHIGAPQVAYRETITRRVEQTYGRLTIRFEALPAGTGFRFESRASGTEVSAVESALIAVSAQGVVSGFPTVDFMATLIRIDGPLDARICEIAARACYREALPKAGPVLLEPVMRVEVTMPDDCLGAIVGDLNSRRGQVAAMEMRHDGRVVIAFAPLSNLFGYVQALETLARGQASFAMEFSHYQRVPPTRLDDRFPPAIGMRA